MNRAAKLLRIMAVLPGMLMAFSVFAQPVEIVYGAYPAIAAVPQSGEMILVWQSVSSPTILRRPFNKIQPKIGARIERIWISAFGF
jgi:hypothetical protein